MRLAWDSAPGFESEKNSQREDNGSTADPREQVYAGKRPEPCWFPLLASRVSFRQAHFQKGAWSGCGRQSRIERSSMKMTNSTITASISALRARHAQQAVRRSSFQTTGQNLTGRLNVINFAGLFSGTGIAPPRSVNARLRYDFLG